MNIVVEFDTDNDAFFGAMLPGEVSRVFLRAEEKIEDIRMSTSEEAEAKLLDSNGNTVGFVRVTR